MGGQKRCWERDIKREKKLGFFPVSEKCRRGTENREKERKREWRRKRKREGQGNAGSMVGRAKFGW